MKCALHGAEQCPLCHTFPPLPPDVREPHPSNIAVDADGNPLPYSPEEVQRIQLKAVDEGKLMVAVFLLPSGDLACQVFGSPSREILEALETLTASYRRTLELDPLQRLRQH